MQVFKVFFPAKLTIAHPVVYFFGQVNKGEIIMPGDHLMVGDLDGYPVIIVIFCFIGISKSHQHNVHSRVDLKGMAYDSFQSKYLGKTVGTINMVVYRCFEE